MTSNINGNALTLYEKVKREFTNRNGLEDLTEHALQLKFDRLTNSQLLELISEALEEMFA